MHKKQLVFILLIGSLSILFSSVTYCQNAKGQFVQHFIRGGAYLGQGDADSAIAEFNKAIEIDPNIAEIYYHRGVAYTTKGFLYLDQAISDFNKAIEIYPRYSEAYRNRGLAYGSEYKYDQAISDFNKAIEINPSDAHAYNGRAIVYFRKQEYQKSWEDVYKAEELGYKVNPDFLEGLKKASGREK